jgi:hypothetical protein
MLSAQRSRLLQCSEVEAVADTKSLSLGGALGAGVLGPSTAPSNQKRIKVKSSIMHLECCILPPQPAPQVSDYARHTCDADACIQQMTAN